MEKIQCMWCVCECGGEDKRHKYGAQKRTKRKIQKKCENLSTKYRTKHV